MNSQPAIARPINETATAVEPYIADLEKAGATVASAKYSDSRPVIHVEFAGGWVDRRQRVESMCRLPDESGEIRPEWLDLIHSFPDRFVVGWGAKCGDARPV